jgi:hypothetical protein
LRWEEWFFPLVRRKAHGKIGFLPPTEETHDNKGVFDWSGTGRFQQVSAYSLSQITIDSAEIYWSFYQPNTP